MEIQTNYNNMLEQLPQPAFLVKDGVVYQVNQAALNRGLSIGNPVTNLINIGQQEYSVFCDGRLSLTLTLNGVIHNASVVKCEQMDLFYLDSDYEASELRAFALTAQCLRDPLSKALSSIDAIDKDNIKQSPELAQQVKKVNQSLYQILRTVSNMSDVTSYDHPRHLRMESRNVTSLLDELLSQASDLAASSGRTLEYALPNRDILCMIDSEKIERAVLNLISNAIKFSPQGSAVKVSMHTTKEKLYFSVQNEISNIISNADIFTRYMREPGLDARTAGIGLGIVMVRNAAIAHGGTLLFEHPSDSTIRFTMSITMKRKTELQVNSPFALPYDYAGGYNHILLELADILPSDLFE